MNQIVPQQWSHPPGCSCGCGGGQWGDVMDCWKEIAQFKAFLMQVLSEMGPIPIQGVVDGSDAKPGYVGEFITASSNVNFAAYPAVTSVNVSPIVIPPGDWDIMSSMEFNTRTGPVVYRLSPLPTGVSGDMAAGLSISGAVAEDVWPILISKACRGSFSTPTLLPVLVTIYQSADSALTAGTATLLIQARRRR